MEFIILGLLRFAPMTGYEISQFIRSNLSMICSSSAGSMQAALKKLLLTGDIGFREGQHGKKRKKIFYITEKGKQEFDSWIQNPMQTEKVRNMQLSKLFFLGFAPKEKRLKSIQNYIAQLQEAKDMLLCIKKNFESIKEEAGHVIASDDAEDILTFQAYTLDHGIQMAEFEMGWYTSLLEKEISR